LPPESPAQNSSPSDLRDNTIATGHFVNLSNLFWELRCPFPEKVGDMKNQPSRKRVNAGNGVAPLMQFNNPIQTKNMTTPYLRNSINPLLWRYGFFLIALVSLTVNNVVGGTVTSRSGLVISGHPSSTQLSAQESQEDASKAHEATIIVFDPPGAATVASPACGAFCGTISYAINAEGAIVGFYTDANVVPHGFLRTPDGNIISFDAPGAGLGFGLNEGTVPLGINDSGEITGQHQDSSLVFHGFLRYADGSFATFDAPGAGTGAGQGTLGYGINSNGEITGLFFDANNVYHGFVRDPNGSITTLDAPGAGTGTFQGTFTSLTAIAGAAINSKGEVAESLVDANNVYHGFVRDPNGVFTTFEAPGESNTNFFPGTSAVAINSAGDITGQFSVATDTFYVFLRDHNGKFTTFGFPGATLGRSLQRLTQRGISRDGILLGPVGSRLRA
jgi:hypothetical protein